jgi:nitroimidazol reductase NimA-like FMN-containing flavoprotein (pyridoxamine 5'-phosphate oxidase superfamily)
MQITKKLEIQSKKKIIEFLNNQLVGRIASIDINGYPQIIPMNFVYLQQDYPNPNNNLTNTIRRSDAVYMHSYPLGEKLDNIKRNSKVGFEVDQHICFLPSYYFHPTDASQADTLYISVVIKGTASIVEDNEEKTQALNGLMKKYQKEGKYEILDSFTPAVHEVAVIKIVPKEMRGKYKIGQHWAPAYRLKMAKHIIEREEKQYAETILNTMGINISPDGRLIIREEPLM